MARPLRIEYAGALYHVTSRGDRQEAIFEDDQDRTVFLNVLGEVISRFRWRCHAYCLMGNHYHLMIETPEGNLTKGMRQLNGVFTQWSNRRHKRSGHVFQGRYKAILVDRESYFLELARYIVLNPVRAAMVKHPNQWKWSSYGATSGMADGTGVATTDDLADRVRQSTGGDEKEVSGVCRGGERQREHLERSAGTDLLGRRQVCGTDAEQAGRAGGGCEHPENSTTGAGAKAQCVTPAVQNRDDGIRAAYQTGAYSYQQIGKEFGVHFTTVGRIVRQH